MTCIGSKTWRAFFNVNKYVGELEKYTDVFKQQLNKEKEEHEHSNQKISSLINSFCRKEQYEIFVPMRISLPEKNPLLDGFFKEDTEKGFLFSEDREEKRRKLAAERKAEYNAYLARKEKDLLAKRKLPVEQSTDVNPKSVLESVDYETILAKRKEEEIKFRQFNYAEHHPNEDINKIEQLSVSSAHSRENEKKSNSSVEEIKRISPHTFPEKFSNRSNHYDHLTKSQESHFQRTGGGGEPVKDSQGNLITVRGFKESLPLLPLPSFKEDFAFNKKDSYRKELARQIEEKKRLEALDRQKALEEEEKAAQRIEQQRLQMLMEYQNELKSNNNRKEQQQQERLRKLEEFQKKDAALRHKNREIKPSEAKPAVLVESTNTFTERSLSPPVPAVRTKEIFKRPLTSPVLSPEQSITKVSVKPDSIFSSLAEIRKKIMQDQKNLNRITKRSYEVMNRRTVPDVVTDEDDFQGISESFEDLKT